MPQPLAICIEDLEAANAAARFVRCVALPGRQPGLRVDARGEVVWKSERKTACELWVSADDRLILYRPAAAPPVTVRRAGRQLQVPHDKPVVLLDQDEFETGARRLRVHVHGTAAAVAAPSPFVPSGPLLQMGRAAAVAVALGAAVAAGVGCQPIDVREHPPAPLPPPDRPPVEVRERPPDVATPPPPHQEIEVREQPPAVIAPNPEK